jgi:hypothetical protein
VVVDVGDALRRAGSGEQGAGSKAGRPEACPPKPGDLLTAHFVATLARLRLIDPCSV